MARTAGRDEAIGAARVFNRFFSESVGALSDAHLGTGLSLGHARVLFEIGRLAPIEMQALRGYLGLDAGYLSRTLTALEEAGLIRSVRSRVDGRARRVQLTAKGRKKIEMLDDRSDERVAGWFDRLDAAESAQLLAAMSTIRRLLSFDIAIERRPADDPAARACLAAYFAELDRRFPGGFDPGRSVTADAHETSPPVGRFLVVTSRGLPRGCGAVKTLEAGVGEIKRMWVHPELRGAGVGRRLLAALEASSAELGHHTVRLDTSDHLPEAHALYRAAGYREVAPYNDNPYARHWFEKRLA